LRILDPPAFVRHGNLLPAGTIDRDRREHLERAAIRSLRHDANSSAVFVLERPQNWGEFAHLRAFAARVFKQHQIEVRALDLPGCRAWVIVVLEKIKWLRLPPVLCHELHAVFLHVSDPLHFFEDSKPFECEPAKRHQRFADAISRKLFLLEHQHPAPSFRKQCRSG
jgi:hypothetical protein